jgi:molybdate transport system ATP-binding protein
MILEVDVRHRYGAFTLDVRFATDGRLTVLFGRSGAGKTSLANIIGGLLRPDHGRIVVNGRVLVDTDRKLFVARHRRRVGYVFQEARLFPHLSVRQNLLYGRWFTPSAERRERLDHVTDLLDIGHLLKRGPALLSGGEKQRVAIGRALLASPQLLIMDEPLASLDEALKAEIIPYIERLRDENSVPIIFVSHSVPEVTRLATTMVLLDHGKIAAVGPLAEIMGRADLVELTGHYEAGASIEMHVAGHDETYDLTILRSPAGELRIPRMEIAIDAALRVRIRARDVMLALAPPDGVSALNVLLGRITEIATGDGPVADVRVDLAGQALQARVTRLTLDRLGLAPAQAVYAIIKTVALDRNSLGPIRPRSESVNLDEITL